MAVKYARAGGGNWSADATWSTTSGGTADTVAPTSADDIVLDASSGNVIIDAVSACRSLDCSAYTGTLTHNNGANLSIGDATAGAGNKAVDFSGAFTYTLGNVVGSRIYFTSTSATQQTINFGGKTTGDINVGQGITAGNYLYTGGHVCGSAATMKLICGTLNINGQTCSWGNFDSSNSNTRTLTLGAANITTTGNGNSWQCTITTNFTLDSGTSTITFTGSSIGFYGGTGKTYYNVIFSGSGFSAILSGGTITFNNLTRTGTATTTDTLQLTGNITCNGTFIANGNSETNRLTVRSGTAGVPRTITAASVSCSNIAFKDITAAGAGDWDLSEITGDSIDLGGNTGITFTPTGTHIFGDEGMVA